MKHSLKFILAMAMMVATLPAIAALFTVNNIVYVTSTSGNVWVYKGTDCKGSVTIPSVVKNPSSGASYNVVGVYDSAFYNNKKVTDLSISSYVTKLGKSAFKGCYSLKSVTLHEGLVEIGARAFEDDSLVTSISIPSTVTTIGDYAFTRTGLTSIVIPDNVETMDVRVCFNMPHLKSAVLSSKVKTIPTGTFMACSSLTFVKIPEGVTAIGNYVFTNCLSLASITLPSTMTQIGDQAFYYCNILSSICCLGKTAPTCASEIAPYSTTYQGYKPYRVVWVRSGCRSAYASDSNWTGFGTVLEMGGAATGDLNKDGKVDVSDTSLLLNEILK